MFGSNKKGDNKTSSGSSAKTNGTPKYGGSSYSSSTTSKYPSLNTGSSTTKTTTSSNKYASSFGSSVTTKSGTTTSTSKYGTDAYQTSYGKPTSTSSAYKSTSLAISSPKITDFSKQEERRPLNLTPYKSNISSNISKSPFSSDKPSSFTSFPEFETELRKYNIESSPDNYAIYKQVRNELPYRATGNYITASKLTTIRQSTAYNSSSTVSNSQLKTTSSAIPNTLAAGALIGGVPAIKSSGRISSNGQLKSFSTNDPRKPVTTISGLKPQNPNENKSSVLSRHLSDDTRYPARNKKGFAVIFNFENFKDSFSRRDGTENDVAVLEKLFKKFNISMDYGGVKKDLTLKELEKAIKAIEKKDLSKYDCLVVVILSHGSNNDYVSATDKLFNMEDTVVGPITSNKTLKGKPKIFIIQACRGDQRPPMQKDSVLFRTGFDASDIIKCFSTYTNQVALRDPSAGSVFIQTFYKYVLDYGERYHIADIMEKVRKEVNENCQQTPETTSTLTKKFYFGDLIN